MEDCCGSKQTELEKLGQNQVQVLRIVLAINLVMFFIEGYYGWISRSTSLQADSLDMLGDVVVYGTSLYAISRGVRWTARISLGKGLIMGAFGIWIVSQALYRFFSAGIPVAETMGWVGLLALAANVTCAVLLLRHRSDDINMRSTWLCSRNDVIANFGVLGAAGAVAFFQSKYPDLIVGVAISALVLKSSYSVIRDSLQLIKDSSTTNQASS